MKSLVSYLRTGGGFRQGLTDMVPPRIARRGGTPGYLANAFSLLTEVMYRQRAAPYIPPTLARVDNSPNRSNKAVTDASLRDPPNPEHPINPPSTASADTDPHPARLASRNVVSRSGTVYTLLPYTVSTQVSHRPLTDVEDPRPELPDPRPASPVTDVELHEDPPSDGANGAAQEVITVGVRPPTPHGEVPAAAGDDEVAAIAKKILEYYKRAAANPGIGSEVGEEEQEEK